MIEEKKGTWSQKHQEQRDRLVEVAERVVSAKGIDALKTREVAKETGISLGQIYNLVEDRDELLLLVASRTLARLERQLEQALASNNAATPQESLITIAVAYHHFARDNYHLWRGLFDHRLDGNKFFPEWVRGDRLRPFHFVERFLLALIPDTQLEQISLLAQSVFSAVHGMVSLALTARDVGVEEEKLDEQISLLLRLLCCGLVSPPDGVEPLRYK